MRVLLDTNAYTALMADRGSVAERVRKSERVLVSTIVLGELLFGFHDGTRNDADRQRLDAFLSMPRVELLPVTAATAEFFGLVATHFRKQGTPIPTNDIWIAAQAMEAAATLLSADAHFEKVAGLLWSRLS